MSLHQEPWRCRPRSCGWHCPCFLLPLARSVIIQKKTASSSLVFNVAVLLFRFSPRPMSPLPPPPAAASSPGRCCAAKYFVAFATNQWHHPPCQPPVYVFFSVVMPTSRGRCARLYPSVLAIHFSLSTHIMGNPDPPSNFLPTCSDVSRLERYHTNVLLARLTKVRR